MSLRTRIKPPRGAALISLEKEKLIGLGYCHQLTRSHRPKSSGIRNNTSGSLFTIDFSGRTKIYSLNTGSLIIALVRK